MSQDAIIEKSKAVAHSKETIESPCVNEKLLFAYPWVVWEQYEVKGGGDWSNSLAEVARFSDVEGFWRVWNTIPHSDPSNFSPSLKWEILGLKGVTPTITKLLIKTRT